MNAASENIPGGQSECGRPVNRGPCITGFTLLKELKRNCRLRRPRGRESVEGWRPGHPPSTLVIESRACIVRFIINQKGALLSLSTKKQDSILCGHRKSSGLVSFQGPFAKGLFRAAWSRGLSYCVLCGDQFRNQPIQTKAWRLYCSGRMCA